MPKAHNKILGFSVFLGCLGFLGGGSVWAQAMPQSVPPTAEAYRLDVDRRETLSVPIFKEKTQIEKPSFLQEIPVAARSVRFVLRRVDVKGASSFTKEKIQEIFKQDIGHDILLAKAWAYAAELTKLYRQEGFFLSRAYVPEQNLENGVLVIKAVEGFIRSVDVEGDAEGSALVKGYADRIIGLKPLTLDKLESVLLRLNDLPGLDFRAVLVPSEKEEQETGIVLKLMASRKESTGQLKIDNAASRYIGPHQITASYDFTLAPMHRTYISLASDRTFDRMRSVLVSHTMALYPDWTMALEGSWTVSMPKDALEVYEMESESQKVGATLSYQWIKQRDKAFSFQGSLEAKEAKTTIFGNAFSKDHLRVARASITGAWSDSFSFLDNKQGVNAMSVTASQGLPALGASNDGDTQMSRLRAEPAFRKIEASFTRQQKIDQSWSVKWSSKGQLTDSVLPSSEELGYGGERYGSAYDGSEFLGDNGMMSRLKLEYTHHYASDIILRPYIFCDGGLLWQKQNSGSDEDHLAAAMGAGLWFHVFDRVSGELAVSVPLFADINTPLYGASSRDPRGFFRLSMDF